jgi:hypothetical protein
MADHRKEARERYACDADYRERARAANRKWRAANRAKIAAYQRKRYAEDPEYRKLKIAAATAFRAVHQDKYAAQRDRYNARRRERYASDADYRERRRMEARGAPARASLLKHYGLRPADYDAMLARQQGVCAICAEPSERRSLDVDHCHETNAVRGLLCNACNVGLARFKDQPRLLRVATTYLEAARAEYAFTLARGGTPSRQRKGGDMTKDGELINERLDERLEERLDERLDAGRARRVMRAAILRELQSPAGVDDPPPANKLQQVVRALVTKAAGQDVAAIREILDRIDGKTMSAASAPEEGPKEVSIRWKSPTSS